MLVFLLPHLGMVGKGKVLEFCVAVQIGIGALLLRLGVVMGVGMCVHLSKHGIW
jgi:hypothetical protein